MGKTNKEKVIKRAEQKILANIYYIYENVNVAKEIKKIRKKFLITDDYFIDRNVYEHPEYKSIKIFFAFNNLHLIVISTILAWTKISLKGENKLDQVINNLGKKKYESWFKKITKPGIKKNPKINFVLSEIFKYFTNKNPEDINKPMRINPRIWGLLITAKVFEIPQKTIIKSMKSILQNYLPSVNDAMEIRFNELTSAEEMKNIWPEVKKQQRAYTAKYGIIQKYPYLNHDRDRRAYEIATDFPELSRQEIIESLKSEEFDEKIEAYYISKIIKRYKKFINK